MHWDGCVARGALTAGHNHISRLFARMVDRLGGRARVHEVFLGTDRNGRAIKGDGTFRIWESAWSADVFVWDTAITTGCLHSRLRHSATTDLYAPTAYEGTKIRLKRAAAEAHQPRGYRFLPVVLDSYSAFGPSLSSFIEAEYRRRMDKADTRRAKFLVGAEKLGFIASMSATVQRRNFGILWANARPLDGVSDARPPPDTDATAGDLPVA